MNVHSYEEGGIFHVVMCKQPSNNMDTDFLDELSDAFRCAEEDKVSKIVLLSSGIPLGFSSGLDLAKSCAGADRTATRNQITAMVRGMYRIASGIIESDKIYIAAVTQAAIGCGATLALCCDFCIADKSAWFWFPDTMYGGISADATTDLLTRLVGTARAKQMIMTNDRIDAKKAYEFGLLYKITERAELSATATAFCKRLQRYSYLSLKETKKLLNENMLSPFREEKVFEVAGAEETFQTLMRNFNREGNRCL